MIRTATLDDLLALCALEEDLFGVDAWSEHSVLEELTGQGRRFLVASDESGGVIGYAVTRTSGDVVDLMRMGVHPGQQRRGVASRLLDAALEGTQSAARMLLEVSVHNMPAVSFYVARQFNVIDVRPHYYRDGSEALVMCRWLPAATQLVEPGQE